MVKTKAARASAAPKKVEEKKSPAEARVFAKKVDVPDPTSEQAKARAKAVVVADHQQRTAIELRRDGNEVIFIPLAVEGFSVQRESSLSFDKRFRVLHDYPVGRAARLYVGYATESGGTEEAMAELGKLVQVTEEEKRMATGKLAAVKPVERATQKGTTKKQSKGGGEAKAPKQPRGPSAASRFKELIMQGKLTDEQIFQTVQKEFKLDDGKRTYVAWYRNSLKKAGQNPPEPKADKKTAA